MKHLGEQFLHERDPSLHTTEPVEHEQTRKQLANKETSEKPIEKLYDWMEVIKQTHTEHRDDLKIMERIKNYYHKQHIIKPENVPQAYFDLQGKIAVDEGRKGDLISAGVQIEEYSEIDKEGKEIKKQHYHFPEEESDKAITALRQDQTKSLDNWLDYLTSENADVYPMWAKYWAFKSVINMGKLVKRERKNEAGEDIISATYKKRNKDTTAPFPTLNQNALAKTIGAIKKRLELKEKVRQMPKKGEDNKEKLKEFREKNKIKNESLTLTNKEFEKLLDSEDFAKLYAQFLLEIPEYTKEGLQETTGKWIKYDQGSDPKALVESLQGYPLEWCTADLETARIQLQNGDFYVYYSINQNQNPQIPRAAIRMEQNKIAEVRGIAPNQNLDPYIAPELDKKLKTFGSEGEKYQKKSQDMKKLTDIEEKTKNNQALNREDLIFLYEIDSKIEGFGYQTDPRIKEIREKRNPQADILIILECEPNQIAHNQTEITENTKAYIGPLYPNIFKELSQIEHIYTEFPEGKIKKYHIEIGGKTKEELEHELTEKDFKISDNARTMMKKPDFYTTQEPEQVDLIRLKVKDLGFPNGATTDQIYAKAEKMVLELCPPETGPHLRLKLDNQPQGDYFWVGMKQISDSGGYPGVFYLSRGADGQWLGGNWMFPGGPWAPGRELVFRSSK
ncbi:MAG: hypothetical protein A2725_03025 [Candidatus Magasanikbacteria bacterium RIFCSPHIGHO2_01_FULL_33_34]|uniref:Uncharacterized protein n=1 Tax=Candidatus Magasanikbacteria bacterium RIFCSPHIGHO2_01_FULL_33_34 TaxID=1798671 RepID=A0A1F6LH35_9BACT|nr:MAG: hypothetical protein A2725_03025 [Candidatus Magasanikbacteria bacterium RIFCSPHIGHO2_01_FULL_33_34]OGH66105.1 MAG: hypothetical protein A3B83_00515 [Candidatus Magasanikbacteria bacterium RIFCSPHIGHO2_02_FULL_33_17]OGH75951.1 MAG: hypothetical protein A3A89_00425 [Candidatus Magasanikbacteria bacterium RIFCSPLOWO2_01_FULL_33_34]